MTRYVIIGGGIAGTTAAGEIRAREADAQITVVSEEQHPLYSRVLLPHYIKGKIPREKCFLKKDSWYEEQRVEWFRAERVVAIDAVNKHVELLHAGRELPYDKLLITTGGEPHYLERDLRGLCYLQTLEDADHLLQLLGEVRGKPDAHAGVCGGGFIACEFLNIFKHFGLSTTCFHRGPWFWSRVLDEESGGLIAQTLEASQVKTQANTTLADIHGEHGLSEVETSSGLFRADILGIGIGLLRDLRWIQKAGIETAAGVRTNAYLETSVADVYAAGDICEHFDVVTGEHMLVGNYMNAQMQGRTAARNMMGDQEEFRLVSGYATHIFELDVIFVGDTRRALADEILVKGRVPDGYVVQEFKRKGRLVGATLVGGNKDRMELTRRIQAQLP
ncbi:MAG: NAD(P)H-nitrite reductase [Parcubacteria group bacterium GW2011_GWA2_56_7]|nr:MAG: NAD(P)H-nitrite reductase [Parcubacteria group bacterium GW2011_GWA2_56_7]